MAQTKKIIVAYGFEYDALISDPGSDIILCKCLESHNPFYAWKDYIEDTSMEDIKRKLDILEISSKDEMKQIDKLAKYRVLADGTPCKPCWRTVIFYENIKFNHLEIGYESEGDENGDAR